MKKKSSKIIYKLITILTLVLPTSIYILLAATIFNVQTDHYIDTNGSETMQVSIQAGLAYVYDLDELYTYQGNVVRYDDRYALFVARGEVVKIDKDFYKLIFKVNEETNVEVGTFEIMDLKKLKKEESYKIPIGVFIAIFAFAVASIVVFKKMKLTEKYKRTAVLISLIIGTATLAIINVIVTNMLWVFVTFTISWVIYMVEYSFVKGKIEEAEKDDIIGSLNKALKK